MIRHVSIIFINIFFLLTFCTAKGKDVYLFTSFHEPATEGLRLLYSEDGRNWDSIPGIWLKPELGEQKLMRDPSMTKGPDGTYHLVWTTSWKGDKGFGYASSKDLIHWSRQKMISVMTHEPGTVNVWAPEIFYDDLWDMFLIVWASCVPNRFENGVEDADNNHRLYYVTTKDFDTFSETRLFLDPGFSVIDAILVKRASNDYVMVLKDNTRPNRNLKISFANSFEGPWTTPSVPFTGEFVEGPTVAKVDDDYFVYFDAYREKIYGVMKTKDFVSFEDITTEIHIPEGHKHGTIVKVPLSLVDGLKKAKNG